MNIFTQSVQNVYAPINIHLNLKITKVNYKIRQINKKFKLKHHVSHIDCSVRYTNEVILKHGFHFGEVKDIINTIHHNNIDNLNIYLYII